MKQTAMADQELDPTVAPCLHLVSAFLAMEPTDSLISLARVCDGGSITERLQNFIWDNCINKALPDWATLCLVAEKMQEKEKRKIHLNFVTKLSQAYLSRGYCFIGFQLFIIVGKCNAPYIKNFLKKLINEVESNKVEVLDELYEQYAHYMTSLKEDNLVKGDSMIRKSISFLFSNDCLELPSCPSSMKLVVPLQCSLNMLEGDTGCSVWPSSLFLSEFILSCPEIFSNKSCFEVGSGVGLVGICLAHVKASKVILSDGDLSTLTNLKLNLKLNQLSSKTDFPERTSPDSTVVNCIHLPWESAPESGLHDFMPDTVLGADVIYDPSCLPDLIQVLAILLDRTKSSSYQQEDGCLSEGTCIMDGKVEGTDEILDLDRRKISHTHNLDRSDSNADAGSQGFDACKGKATYNSSRRAESLFRAVNAGPVAYIASVIRNIDTFNHFLALADEANLVVTDLTGNFKLFDLLPYMQSYNRTSIRLFSVSYLCN